MKRLLFAALSVGLVTTQAVGAQGARTSIQGVWRAVEATITGPGARTIAFGDRPNLTIITARHYSRVQIESEGARPMLTDPAKATADALRATWGPFNGEAGTYIVEGNVITMRPIAAKNPAAMTPGAFTTWSYKLTGDTLVVTAERNEKGPIPNPVTVKAVRLE